MDHDLGSEEPIENPRQTANFFSVIFFLYTVKFFKLGNKRELTESDLYQVLDQDRSHLLGDRLEKEWYKELRKKNPSLFRAIYKMFYREYYIYCCVLFVLQFLRLSQLVALYYVLLCYKREDNGYTINDAYLYISWISFSTIFFVLIIHSYAMGLQHMGMKIRVACSVLVYRKCLKLSVRGLAHSSTGQLVNMLCNDVTKFDYVTVHLPYLCVLPFEAPVLLYVVYVYLGYIPYAGCSVMYLLIPILIVIGLYISRIRMKMSIKTDERVRLMGEIISGIKVIKMYVWELPFTELLTEARRLEMKELLRMEYLKGSILSLALYMSKIALFISLALYVYLGHVPTAEFIFIAVALFNVLRQNNTIFIPYIVAYVSECVTSIKRLQAFLLMDNYKKQDGYDKRESIGISLKGVSASWDPNFSATLKDITLTVEEDEIVAVVGVVGSGKSSLLYAILGELVASKGMVSVEGKVSYAAQEPWLFNSSIRKNILFGEEFDNDRYNEVVEVCALKRDFSLLPYGDLTPISDKGITLSGGQKARIGLARAVYKEADIYLLDDPLSAVDSQSGKHIFNECIMGYLVGKCRVLVTHQLQNLKNLPRIIMMKNGVLYFDGNFPDLTKVDENFTKTLESSDVLDSKDDVEILTGGELSFRKSMMPPISREKKFSGGIECKIYFTYLKCGGGVFPTCLFLFLFVAAQVLSCACDVFLMLWVNSESKGDNSQENVRQSMYIYSVLAVSLAAMSLVRTLYFFKFFTVASTKLHEKMFECVVRAPMSFFNSNPAGRILNRFSKDIGLVDDVLPLVTLDTIQIGLYVLGVLILTSMVNPVIIVPMVLIGALFFVMKYYYLKTGRDVKRIEGITRSPVFTHLDSSLQGLTTIRAFGAEEILVIEFERLLDIHSSAWHIFLSTARAFGFILDIICALFIACVCYSLVIFAEGKLPGDVGLVITQSLTLTGILQWGIRQWSEMENQMTSVERAVEYTTIPSEKLSMKPVQVPRMWPEKGEIEFKHLYMRYTEKGALVLNDLNFKVNAHEKVGIVGRTGAGKSSLIGSIFQLTTTDGEILIDGIDIRKIPLDILRYHISIIPQEPMLFKGSIRKNVDPFDEYSDSSIWTVLSSVRLTDSLELPHGLTTMIYEGGSNYSIGQKQLLCLARAILKQHTILILDEVTANVDPYTDSLIQYTIRQKFAKCTVLTIAHRLNTVIDSDKVLVMDEGQCKEFDHPYLLLQNPESLFYNMVRHTGKAMADYLTKLAKENYELKMGVSSQSQENKN